MVRQPLRRVLRHRAARRRRVATRLCAPHPALPVPVAAARARAVAV